MIKSHVLLYSEQPKAFEPFKRDPLLHFGQTLPVTSFLGFFLG